MRFPRTPHGVARGFTLLELMVVLVILGILAGLGFSAFRSQMLRAKRTEAIIGLGAIHRAQTAHKAATQNYGDSFDEIGFKLDGARRVDERTIQGKVYTFTMQALPLDGDPRGNYRALATGDLDSSDPILDILMIENFLPAQP